VSGACLVFATRGTDWGRVWAVLQGAHFGWVVAIVVTSLACHAIRAERWRVLLRPVGRVPFLPAFSATLVGFGASTVLPLRLGEIVRPAFLARQTRVPLTAAVSSVVLERIFDILLVICCFLVVGLIYEVPAELRRGAIVLGAAAGAGLVTLVVMQRRRAATEAFVRRVLRVLPSGARDGIWRIVEGVLGGLAGLGDVGTIAVVLGSSVALWIMIAVTYLLGFLALDMDVPLVAASLATMVIVAAFVFLPQAPAFIGTWQLGCVAALKLFGVSQDVALSYAFLTWIVQVMVNVGSAGTCLAFQDVSLRQLVAERSTAERESA